jgi:septum formation protein
MIHLTHQVHPSGVDEVIPENCSHAMVTEYLSLLKGNDVSKKYPEALIIAADTIVVLDDEILGKPVDAAEATTMLNRLSGRTHEVITGVALLQKSKKKSTSFHQTSKVTFSALSSDEIEAYVKTGSPMDKAGAYGIQDDMGSLFVESIEGDYYNIVGLPVNRLYNELKVFAPDVVTSLFHNAPKTISFA